MKPRVLNVHLCCVLGFCSNGLQLFLLQSGVEHHLSPGVCRSAYLQHVAELHTCTHPHNIPSLNDVPSSVMFNVKHSSMEVLWFAGRRHGHRPILIWSEYE